MIAVTGRPEPEQITHFLCSLNAVGIEQFLIYPRSGCEVAYMSEEWFAVIAAFIQSAEALDMQIWLYDDFNWPSGHCGGKVVQNEAFRLKSICIRGAERGKIHSGLNQDDFFGYGKFPDLLSEAATDYFIQCTHEMYFGRFREHFGKTIVGIFTDEPSVAYACGENDVPYYVGLERDYAEATGGRTLSEAIRETDEELSETCMRLVNQRFRKCYIQKLSAWCRAHGIVMTGHLLHDDSPYKSARNSGGLLESLSDFMQPGIDEIYSDLDAESEFTLWGAIDAVAQEDTMAEMFALGPCDMPYAKKRCMLYLAACFGVNHYFCAISPLDMRGNAIITDFFNCFSVLQPDFQGMRLLKADATDAALLAKKQHWIDVYIRYPKHCYIKNILSEQSDQPLYRLVNELSKMQIQWKFLQEADTAPTGKDVISFDETLQYMFNGAPASLDEILQKYIGKASVLLETGELPERLFVRRFVDGSIMALNLSNEPVECCYQDITIPMEGYGVWKSTDAETDEVWQKAAEINGTFFVEYRNENVIRSMFLNEQKKSTIDCKCVTRCGISVRKGAPIKLDGKDLLAKGAEYVLPEGMRELYDGISEVQLCEGIHEICSENDLKYMPSILLHGSFLAEVTSGDVCGVVLSELPHVYHVGERIPYYGQTAFTQTVQMPENCCGLQILGSTLYTRLYLNGHLMGESIAQPHIFRWNSIPGKKTFTLCIEQHSSIGPIFGDVAYYDAHVSACSWRGTPSTNHTLFGFESACFLVKNETEEHR